MPDKVPITIIGGGAVGCAIAYELSKRAGEGILLAEKNSSMRGENQSSRNSGVIHAGIYYLKKDTPLKARFCVEGNAALYDFCKKHGVPHKKTGKLVVATNPAEEEYLNDTETIARENGVPGVVRISGERAKELEPNVSAASALYVPTSGIVEPTKLVAALCRLAQDNGVSFAPGNEVVGIKAKDGAFAITAKSGGGTYTFETGTLINSAGLFSDDIARMVSPASPYRIEPVRGEAAKFYKTKRADVSMSGMNVYPAPYGYYNDTGKKAEVPFSEFQTLLAEGKVSKAIGVHLTPTFDLIGGEYSVGNTVTIGPTSTVGVKKDDYGSNLAAPKFYFDKVKRFFPNIRLEDIELHQAGIRAKLASGRDFIIERDPLHKNCINLVGIDSPGLTSSLAIAKYVRELMRG